ncbi:uncharacterized protein si:dkey-197j19.5 [Electrophorus electricus]|uniref:uncharacterized protein si:dkey-197j19.5 n=1 Tax=Electrophorus electricus TaxID=8005 RepID=UPI0015CFEC49|nr:uncharacterized protein si:dkey-197j19.5 [Electrophorus electricus]XP_035379855.1 uncharacterized protein si:dkey-197j19.5 [Electrophorus electricus]XP_035379856.1 uncharacterized protein si:dkey-197j19.5 [Electrophorus electricus]XP_035379857.1 uncharacterized protein si:dkey-197j19.5 [Electrophorus electricus]XP_035379858.1 uncharacterized protein si:dkey-197j19.5 [Electrophorus electricus]
MACRAFGPPKHRDRVIVAPPMSKCTVSLETCSRDKIPALPITTMLANESEAAQWYKSYPAGKSVQDADWISARRAFREGLDGLGNLDKWFYSKPCLTEIELLVIDRGKQPQKMLPGVLPDTTKVTRPLNRETLQMQAGRKTQDEEAKKKRHVRTRDERATERSKQETAGSRTLDLEQGEILQQYRRDDINREEILANPETVQMGSNTKKSHSYPSSLGGPTGDFVDGFRRQCLQEYLDSLELSQQQGLAISRCTLQKALLYPGDVGVRKEPVFRQAASGVLPGCWGRGRDCVSYCGPPIKGKEDENIDQGALAPRKGHKETNKRQPLTRRATTCAFWPGHDGHVRVYEPVMSRRPEGVLFYHVEHPPDPSPGHWPVNQAGYSTSGDINGCRIYTL